MLEIDVLNLCINEFDDKHAINSLNVNGVMVTYKILLKIRLICNYQIAVFKNVFF